MSSLATLPIPDIQPAGSPDLFTNRDHFPTRDTRKGAASAVRKELARIIASDGFVRAHRMRRFLSFITEETLAGRAASLCEYNIGVSVFDRPHSFEPALDPIVRNDARRLRSKLLEYYHRQCPSECDRLMITVPKGGYVPTFRFVSSGSTEGNSESGFRLCVRLIRTSDDVEISADTFGISNESRVLLRMQVDTTEPKSPVLLIEGDRAASFRRNSG